MSVIIKKAENGWILTDEDQTFVFSHDEDEKTEADAFLHLLYQVKESMGPSESRYSEHRVMVRIEKGDKFEDGQE